MGCFGRFTLGFLMFIIFVTGLGHCSEAERKQRLYERRSNRSSECIPILGVEEQKMPTRFIKPMKWDNDHMTKKEFYEGMEDAEMKGMADDPSAQDIYDEFNR